MRYLWGMAGLTVRPASPSDAGAIAAVHVRAWQTAYRRLLPDNLLGRLSVEDREVAWRGLLSDATGGSLTLVAIDAEQLVGFCTVAAPSRDEGAGERTAEVAATYVDPERWRAGVGSALLDAAFSRLRAGGWKDATLWVFAENAQARAFYATFGFQPDGSVTTHEWACGQTAIRLRVTLA